MAIREIILEGDPVLRKVAEPITKINDPSLQQLIDEMIETMRAANGVGLAAPQIGRSLQLAIIETLPEYDEQDEPIPNTRELYVVINPKIDWQSRKMSTGIEGCLSIPGYVGEVERHHSVIVSGYDRDGHKKRRQFKGWTARIFQHEIDHLNGILYTDRLTSAENYWTEAEHDELVKSRESAE